LATSKSFYHKCCEKKIEPVTLGRKPSEPLTNTAETCQKEMLFNLLLCLLVGSIGALKFSGEDYNGTTTPMGK
jgi:hypothetical protein